MPDQVTPRLVLLTISLFLYLLIRKLSKDLRENPSPINLGWFEAGRRLLHPASPRIELAFYKILVERFGRELLIFVLFSLALAIPVWTFYYSYR